jgi:DNA primase
MTIQTVDLLALIGADVTLKRQAGTHGGEYAGACPFCGGQDKRDADRFRVWPEEGRYWCRRCEKHGDAIQYLRDRDRLTYHEALDRLGLASGTPAPAGPTPAPLPRHDPADPPPDQWQARAVTFCAACADTLWGPDGTKALAWLTDTRGMTPAAIRGASLGYNQADRREDPASWGLPPEHKPVWLPRGVTIPWACGGDLWRVNIRRPVGDPKYIGPAGSGPGLFGADRLASDWPAILTEGEFDALAIRQAAGDLAIPVATGSTAGARRARWLAALALCSVVLVAFDADQAGEEAARYWLGVLPGARRWRPYYAKDADGMARAGGDLRAWVLAGLARE